MRRVSWIYQSRMGNLQVNIPLNLVKRNYPLLKKSVGRALNWNWINLGIRKVLVRHRIKKIELQSILKEAPSCPSLSPCWVPCRVRSWVRGIRLTNCWTQFKFTESEIQMTSPSMPERYLALARSCIRLMTRAKIWARWYNKFARSKGRCRFRIMYPRVLQK